MNLNVLTKIDRWMDGLFAPPEERIHPGQVTEEWLRTIGHYASTDAGVDVTEDNALQIMSVLSCVKVLAESVAQLPLVLYRDLGDRGRERARDHRLFSILHDKPNPEMTSFYLRETLMGHLGVRGNAYAEKELNEGGQVIGLWPLRPDMTKPVRLDGNLKYEVTLPSGEKKYLPRERVLHIPGFGFDGMIGHSPVTLAREAMGLAKATEKYGAKYFGNGAQPGGVLEHPGKVSDKAQENLRESWNEMHQGLDNAHRIAILEEGMKYTQIGLAPEDSQFLETRKFQLADVARMYRVPLHMIGDLDRATFNNIEELSLEFVIYTLMPWLTRWEQQMVADLLRPQDKGLYIRFNVDGLLRGNNQSRWESYAKALQTGVYSINDVLRLEDMNPIEGGDVHLVPLNMIPLEQVSAMPEPGTPPTPEDLGTRGTPPRTDTQVRSYGAEDICEVCGGVHGMTPPLTPPRNGEGNGREERARNVARGRSRLAGSYRAIFEREAERTIKREVTDVRKALRSQFGERSQRDLTTFFDWLRRFYLEHLDVWRANILPILLNYADVIGIDVGQELGIEALTAQDIDKFITRYAENLAKKEVASSEGQITALITAAIEANEDPVPVVEERLDEWLEKRPGKVADHNSHAMLYGAVVAFYAVSRIVSRMTWVANGDSCPYCMELDGRTVGIEEVFVPKDTDFQPDGAEQPMRRGSNTTHPPLHGGCDCGIVAG
jgi:HK97 family phage portal protein